ncbi:MAG: hypothetical protein C0404_06455 [Verrucomicrobia bacterium]|nr:hypothetical protein [Verrucomicrobiota bacterium]
MKVVNGGVTAAKGFQATGIAAGIKTNKLDMAMVFSEKPATVAATFTKNSICAAPVKLCREHLKGGKAHLIAVNSGCANACTGPQGTKDASEMARLAAREVKVPLQTVFVCSTGTIGKMMPMDKIARGMRIAASELASDGGALAARAIMTTDLVDKQFAVEITVDGAPVRIGGMAKGSGMIAPNMATMLAFVTTDAAVDRKALQACVSDGVERSFNSITVDGDQSTNDTVLVLANGAAGNHPLTTRHRDWPVFAAALEEVFRQLAMKIVLDGEGATKFVTVNVSGAASDADARKAARSIANSLLVKTSWFGCDPNWGRVIAAVGYSGARVREELVDITFDGLRAVKGGRKAPDFVLEDLEKVYKQKKFSVNIHLHLGKGKSTVYTCDCSYDYVKINSEYLT